MRQLARVAAAILGLAAGWARAGLVAHYTFEEGAGTTIADVSGNGHTGTVNNADAATWVPGKQGAYALDLNGVNEWVSTLNALPAQLNLDGNKPKSVALWAYTRRFNDGGLFDLGNSGTEAHEFSLRTIATFETWRAQFWGAPDFDVRAFGCVSNWTHFVLVHDGTAGRLYQNGFRIGTKDSTLSTANVRALEIGRYNNTYFFDGIIDDVRVYDHALTEAEVQALAGAALDASERLAPAFTLDAAAQSNAQGMVMIQSRVAAGALNTVADVEPVLSGARQPADPGALGNPGYVATVNHGPGASGQFANDQAWIGGDQFAVRVHGVLEVSAPGTHSFGVFSDDGFALRMGQGRRIVIQYPADRSGRTIGSAHFAEAGLFPFELTYFERDGAEGLELQYWPGTSLAPAATNLLGDTASGSIRVYQNVLTAADRQAGAPASRGSPGFLSARHVAASGYTVNSLYDVERMLAGAVPPDTERRQALTLVNLNTFDGLPADDLGSEFTGLLCVTNPAVHTFTVNSDDGFRLEVGTRGRLIQEANFPKGGSDVAARAAFLDPGLYPFRLTWFERGGGNQVRLTVDGLDLNDAAQRVLTYPLVAATAPATNVGARAGLRLTTTDTDATIDSLFAAWRLARGQLAASAVDVRTVPTVNLRDAGAGGVGHYGNDADFPVADPANNEDFIVAAEGYVRFPAAGFWTVGVNSDDGFVLELGGRAIAEFAAPRGPGDTLTSVYVAQAGWYALALLMYERGGGAEVELFAAPGLQAAWTAADFDLVGDTAAGGLAVRAPREPPPPGTLLLVR